MGGGKQAAAARRRKFDSALSLSGEGILTIDKFGILAGSLLTSHFKECDITFCLQMRLEHQSTGYIHTMLCTNSFCSSVYV